MRDSFSKNCGDVLWKRFQVSTKSMLMFRVSSEAGSTAARFLNWSFFEKWRSDVTNECHRTEHGGGFPDSWNRFGSGIGWKSNLASLACSLRCLLECFSFLIKTIFFEIQELNCTQFRHPVKGGLFVNLLKNLSQNHHGGRNKDWRMV